MESYRKTTQHLMPATPPPAPSGQYGIYPSHPLPPGLITTGYAALAAHIVDGRNRDASSSTVVIDGYPGVLWENFRQQLHAALLTLGKEARWVNVEDAMLPPDQIEALVAPYLGGSDPLFGFRFPGELRDFFDPQKLAIPHPRPLSHRGERGGRGEGDATIHILYGCGAALAGWHGLLVYVDIPKNEIQFRARSKSIRSLGLSQPLEPKAAYKRSYFVDWAAANRHKAAMLPNIDWMIDEQRPDEPACMPGSVLREGLARMARSFFRVRPWFEPGPWGGQWIKAHIPQLAQDVPNYAWSFELITPENGLLFESGGLVLEVSFDLLMFQEGRAVLGECAPNFQYEFPIRYDFLDTFDGGNLSVQCHPRPEYVRANFGESFTQDECYYILDCAPNAKVYLGFQAENDPDELKAQLLHSAQSGQPVEIERYINTIPVQKHDLLLIPNGTVHGAGRDNLVLEISATPYIFTFKMYDWLRMDLDGKPRSLNIERAFENLYFDRKGERVAQEFVSHPYVLESGPDWRLVHLPTHPNHFYDVHRFEFSTSVEAETGSSCHVMSLVEGQSVLLETASGERARFNFAETFVIPAGAGRYRLTSEDGTPLKVVKTFVKPKEQWAAGVVPVASQ